MLCSTHKLNTNINLYIILPLNKLNCVVVFVVFVCDGNILLFVLVPVLKLLTFRVSLTLAKQEVWFLTRELFYIWQLPTFAVLFSLNDSVILLMNIERK